MFLNSGKVPEDCKVTMLNIYIGIGDKINFFSQFRILEKSVKWICKVSRVAEDLHRTRCQAR